MDVLAQNFGRPLTVQEVSDQAKALHGKAHYANTYHALERMRKAGLIRWDRKGRTAVIQLEPASQLLQDHLAALASWNRLRLFASRPDAADKAHDLGLALSAEPGLESAWLLEAERSVRLNRFPILRLYVGTRPNPAPRLGGATRADAAIDDIAMGRDAFQGRLALPGAEPLRAWFASSVCLVGADRFWLGMLHSARRGASAWLATRYEDADEGAVAANLGRFGYEEFGAKTAQAPLMALETLAWNVMRSGSARQKRGLGQVLAENEFDETLLGFMLRREGVDVCKALAGIIASTNRKSPRMRRLQGVLRARVSKRLTRR